MIKTARQLKDLIRNLSKKNAADAQILMRNYMMERFLERISLSSYRDKFILKGGMLVVENSGLLTVASLKQLDLKGKKAVCILSGGNMDVTTMGSMIQNGLIQRGRVFTVSIRVPDKPGQIASMTAIAAEHKANILRIDHNRWVSPNRALAVEVVVTFESFDVDHKREIIKALNEAGFRCNEIGARL